MADTGQDEYKLERRIGVGCVSVVAGFFSGGMIGVMIAKIVGSIRGCQPAEGLPACDWHVYAGAGMLVGVITLPLLIVRRMRSKTEAERISERG
ncbi:MAG: hypothetical protein H0U64_08630 [Gemmatimonadaceae bacterium]|nr:hypothetical protein [Gemmatimonadaceae bacterium]